MKRANDIGIRAVIGAEPRTTNVPSKINPKRNDLILMFPMVWTNDGVSSIITCTAIGETARGLHEWAKPGQPLFIGGELSLQDKVIRCRVTSSQRWPTDLETVEIMGAYSSLLALDGGRAKVFMRGKVARDGVPEGRHYRSVLAVQNERTNQDERFSFLSPVPVFSGQSAEIEGHFTRYTNEEEDSGVILVRNPEDIGLYERLNGPVNRVRRDPNDRLRLDRLDVGAAPSV